MKTYLKLKHDKCPKCGSNREIVVKGDLTARGENPSSEVIIGFKCWYCQDEKRVLTTDTGKSNNIVLGI